MPKRTHPLRPFLFFCLLWPVGPDWAPIRSPSKLLQWAHRKSSVAPVSTVVFSRAATATAMTGGTASRPLVCRKSIGRPISAHPSAPAAIVALRCAISAEGCSGPPHLPIGIRIATQLLPRASPSAAPTSRSLPRWRKRLPAISISLLRTILADMMMRSFGKLLNEPGDVSLAKLGALYFRRQSLRRPQPRSRPKRIFGSRGGVSGRLRPPKGQSGPGCGFSRSRAGFDRSARRGSS